MNLLPLLSARTPESLAHALTMIAGDVLGADECVLWLRDGGRGFRTADGTVRPEDDFAIRALPWTSVPESIASRWTAPRCRVAVGVGAGSEPSAVLVVRFPEPTPAIVSDPRLTLLCAASAAVLERAELAGRVATAQRDAFQRLGAALAHTLGNVLQAALSSVEHARGVANPEARAAIREASDALGRAASIVAQLAAQGGNHGSGQPTELGALVAGLVAAVEPQLPPRIQLRIERAAGEHWAPIDAATLEATLVGLIFEAREALGSEGLIDIAVRPPAGEPSMLEVEVHWTVAEDSSRTRGAVEPPVAITIAAAALAPSGGTVEWRAQEKERGSVVRVPPLTKNDASSSTPRSNERIVPLRPGLKVLLADDEPAVLRGVQRVLAAAGHQVHTARDGAEAVAIAAANHSIDVALVDLTMPRLAGPSLIAALRAELPKAPVLVMTGYASDEMIAALEKAGVYAVLKKPVPAAMLLDSIAAALAGGSTG